MHTNVAAAKGGVEGLVRSMAAELAPRVRVNAVAPSLTHSAMASGLLKSPEAIEAIGGLHPIPRVGQPEDAGAVASFLLSQHSGWVTGQVWGVDGGRSVLRHKNQ